MSLRIAVFACLIAGIVVGVITALVLNHKITVDIIASTIEGLIAGSIYALIIRSGDALADIFWQFRLYSPIAATLGAIIIVVITGAYLKTKSESRLT